MKNYFNYIFEILKFKEFYKEKPLDHFIDTTKNSNTSNIDMKNGRITNAKSGEYKTF